MSRCFADDWPSNKKFLFSGSNPGFGPIVHFRFLRASIESRQCDVSEEGHKEEGRKEEEKEVGVWGYG